MTSDYENTKKHAEYIATEFNNMSSEQVYEWLDDECNVLDYDYIVTMNGELSAVRVYIELNGPTTWISTENHQLNVHWGNSKVAWGLTDDVIDTVFMYYFNRFLSMIDRM